MANYHKWSNEDLEKLRKLCQECNSFRELKEKALDIFPEIKWSIIQSKLNGNSVWTQHFEDKRQRVKLLKAGEKRRKKITELSIEEKSFPKPEVLEVDKTAWERSGQRVGFYSGADFKDLGFRASLIKLGRELSRQEGVHFDVWNGGLVSKKWAKEEIKKRIAGAHADLHKGIIDNFLKEAAEEFSSLIPKLKKPNSNNGNGGYIRLYIVTCPTRDGSYGEEIARRLQELRPEDIRCYKTGGDRIEVKRSDKNKIIWAINPQRPRLPSKYHSQAAEKEIDDKRKQTTKSYPDLWIVAPFASNIHKSDGERDEPYITIGALRRLEEVLVAENQISITIAEYTPEGDRFVRVWNLKDIVANELNYITGLKSGAGEIHRKLVEALKKHRPTTIGILADETGIDRQTAEREMEFLIEKEQSVRKTWPGLHKDPSSQRYDFQFDWIQDKLVYPQINIRDPNFKEDRLLFVSCPHVGFTTCDYPYMVNEIPRRVLNNKVDTIVLLGDVIAGLQHDYLETGEVFGSLNNTDQERFAAELFGTALMRVFRQRFEENFAAGRDVKEVINNSLPFLFYIPGNHDLWQEKEGTIALETFHDKLTNLLVRELGKILVEKGLPAVDIFEVLTKKIVKFLDYSANCKLPSGLTLEMYHPHLARADTTSLRAQKTLDASKSQIIGIGNFHTATVVHNWYPERGQCVAVQAGTLLIYSRFEKRKTKRVDFGAIFLRAISKSQRIIMTESAYFNQSFLKEPLVKWTNLDQLKQKLGVLSV